MLFHHDNFNDNSTKRSCLTYLPLVQVLSQFRKVHPGLHEHCTNTIEYYQVKLSSCFLIFLIVTTTTIFNTSHVTPPLADLAIAPAWQHSPLVIGGSRLRHWGVIHIITRSLQVNLLLHIWNIFQQQRCIPKLLHISSNILRIPRSTVSLTVRFFFFTASRDFSYLSQTYLEFEFLFVENVKVAF